MTDKDPVRLNRVPDEQLDYDGDLIYYHRGKRFTGVGYEEDPEHGLSEISYVDGFQEGPARDWYPSGRLKSEAVFRKNVLHGPSREFDEAGSVVSEDLYEFGIRVRGRIFDSDSGEVVTYEISRDDPNYRLLAEMRMRSS